MMLQTMIVQKADEETVSKYLTFKSDTTSETNLSEIVSERRETGCSYFAGTSDGFTAEINLEKDNIVFFSIPDDIGWEVTVNGEPACIVEANYGLMGICCNVGNNTISAIYHTQGWTLGLVCSSTCLAAWLLLEMSNKRRKATEVK